MVEIGCSIGITIINDPDISASEVLRQADLALCAQRKGGAIGPPSLNWKWTRRCASDASLKWTCGKR
jgi:GGDEF domain-containing protein